MRRGVAKKNGCVTLNENDVTEVFGKQVECRRKEIFFALSVAEKRLVKRYITKYRYRIH